MAGKIIKLWFVLFLVLMWWAVAWGERPQYYGDQASLDWLHKFTTAREFEPMSAHVTGVFKSPFLKGAPAPTTSPYFDTTGLSYYDFGANARLQRQITRSALGYVHTVYTQATTSSMAPRDLYYAAWINTGVQSASEIRVSSADDEDPLARGGFGMVTCFPDGRAVAVYHESYGTIAQLNYPQRGTYVALEAAAGAGTFGNNEFQAPASPKFKDSPIWPDGAADRYKDTNFVHVVSVEGNYSSTSIPTRYMQYTRAKEAFPNNLGIWTTPQIFDTSRLTITPIVVASKISNKVAIIFEHPRKGYPVLPSNPDSLASDADVYYIESTTGGDDWIDGFQNGPPNNPNKRDTFVNVTKYQDSDGHRAFGDWSAAYDDDDSLVIAFTAPVFVPKQGMSASQGSIYFWRRGIGGGASDLREVYNYSISSEDVRRTQGAFPVMNPHIGVYRGVHPDSIGDYYIIWTMGQGNDTTENDPPPLEGFWNQDIYCTATTNNGFSWSAITNLTNSPTPACTVGGCDNDWMASLATDIVNDTMHINYINDKVPVPGGQTRPTDTSRVTPVFYLKAKVPPVHKDTLCAVTPAVLTNFSFKTGVTNDTFVTLSNVGNQTLTIISIVADHPNASVTVVPYGPPGFNIPEGGASAKVFLNFNGSGLPCSSYTVTWTFTTNAENHNLANSKGVFTVKAEFALTTPSQPYVPARTLVGLNKVIETAKGLRMNVSNVGTMTAGGNSKAGLYVRVNADSGYHFLSQGTAYMGAILSNGDTMVARSIYEEAEFRPLYIEGALNETIQVKDTTFAADVTFAQALQQGRPAKSGSWKVVRAAYAIDLFNDEKNFPTLTDTLYPWPGVWMGYWLKDQWWLKNTANYHWVVWYRQKVKKGPPCWWPDWPGSPTIASQIYDGIAMDWDPFSDSVDISTGASLPINSYGYNDTMKFAWARGRGNPFDKRYAAQAFLVDTTVHLKGDSVCVGTNCNVDPCTLSANNPTKRIFGVHPLSYEGFAAQTGGYQTSNIRPWVVRPGSYFDTLNFKQNKQDLTIFTTHACFSPSLDTFAYAIGLAVSGDKGLDTLKKAVNEMRFAMALDTIAQSPCTYKPGDVDGNGSWTLVDIVQLVAIVFKSAPKPTPLCRADCNGSTGNPTLVDIVCLVAKVFKSGPSPVPYSPCCKI